MAKLTKAELEMLGITESTKESVNNESTTAASATDAPVTATTPIHEPTISDEEREKLTKEFVGHLVVATIRGRECYGVCDNIYNTPYGTMLGILYKYGKDEWHAALTAPTNVKKAEGSEEEKARTSALYYCEMESNSLRWRIAKEKASGAIPTREEYMLQRIERIRERIA